AAAAVLPTDAIEAVLQLARRSEPVTNRIPPRKRPVLAVAPKDVSAIRQIETMPTALRMRDEHRDPACAPFILGARIVVEDSRLRELLQDAREVRLPVVLHEHRGTSCLFDDALERL